MLSLTFVRNSNGPHGTLSRTKRSGTLGMGAKRSMYLYVFYFNNMILRFQEFFFYSYRNYCFQELLIEALLNKMLTHVVTLLFFLSLFIIIIIFIIFLIINIFKITTTQGSFYFFPQLFSWHIVLSIHVQSMPSTGTYSQTTEDF